MRPAMGWRAVARAVLAPVVSLVVVSGALAQPAATPRLLVMDLPYARVWEGTIRAFGEQALARPPADGVIETARLERGPRPDEAGVERVAERFTVRVESMADRVTRITVTVEAEALQGGNWRAVDASPATVRAVLDRIRASIG